MKNIIIVSLILLVFCGCQRQVELKQVNNENDSINFSEYEYAEKFMDNYVKLLVAAKYLSFVKNNYYNDFTSKDNIKDNYLYSEYFLNNLNKLYFIKKSDFQIPRIFDTTLKIKAYWEPIFNRKWILDIHSQDFKIALDSNRYVYNFSASLPVFSFNEMIEFNLRKKKQYNLEEIINIVNLFTKIAFSYDYTSDIIDTLTSDEIRSSNLKVLTEKQGYRVTGYLPKSKYNVDYLLDSNCYIIEWDVKYIDESFKEVFKELRKGKIELNTEKLLWEVK